METRPSLSRKRRPLAPVNGRERLVLSAGGSDPETARKARKRASDDHPRRSAVADQALVARAAGSSDRPADHSPARLGGSQSGGPQSVFRIPALEFGYLEDLRLALEDLGLSDAQIRLTVLWGSLLPGSVGSIQGIVLRSQSLCAFVCFV